MSIATCFPIITHIREWPKPPWLVWNHHLSLSLSQMASPTRLPIPIKRKCGLWSLKGPICYLACHNALAPSFHPGSFIPFSFLLTFINIQSTIWRPTSKNVFFEDNTSQLTYTQCPHPQQPDNDPDTASASFPPTLLKMPLRVLTTSIYSSLFTSAPSLELWHVLCFCSLSLHSMLASTLGLTNLPPISSPSAYTHLRKHSFRWLGYSLQC